MTSILFIWVLSAGVLERPVTETFYTVEACEAAARKAYNTRLQLPAGPDTTIIAYCSPKRLSKDR